MGTGTFKVTAKTKDYRRNTTRSSSPAAVFGLSTWAGLAVALVATAFLFINTSADAGNVSIAGPTNSVTLQPQCMAGELDTSFNPGTGVTRGVSVTGFSQAVNALAVQPDGKVLAGGRFVTNDDSFAKLIVRFNSDGSRDTSFNSPRSSGIIAPNGTLPRVLALARQADGRVVIAGDFGIINGESRNGIARLNSDGSLDASFNPGTGVNDDILALAVQPDGKIVIAGNFTLYNGVSRPRVARLNTDGSLDTSFAPGTGAHSRVQAVAIQADGKIVIGGFFDTYNGVTRNDIARINTNGSLDTTFGSGTGANEIRALAIQADGKVVIGGTFTNYRIEKGRWLSSLPVHLIASILLAALYPLAYILVLVVTSTGSASPEISPRLHLFFFINAHVFGILTYWIILTIILTLNYYRGYQEQRLGAARLEAQLKEAELQALRMQLHPHFLFNALHSVTALVLKNENKEAVRMINRLGELLRFAIRDNETHARN